MESRLESMALQVAGWGLIHGDFFDLYDVADQLQIPVELAGAVMRHLRCTKYVDTVAETRNCKRESGKHGATRIFIKVVAILPRPPLKLNVLRSKLVRLSKTMPAPRRSH